jgi:hypothetical protein
VLRQADSDLLPDFAERSGVFFQQVAGAEHPAARQVVAEMDSSLPDEHPRQVFAGETSKVAASSPAEMPSGKLSSIIALAFRARRPRRRRRRESLFADASSSASSVQTGAAPSPAHISKCSLSPPFILQKRPYGSALDIDFVERPVPCRQFGGQGVGDRSGKADEHENPRLLRVGWIVVFNWTGR